MYVRQAERSDIPRIIELFKQIDDLHLELEPRHFRLPFGERRSGAMMMDLMTDPANELWVVAEKAQVLAITVLMRRQTVDHPVMRPRIFLLVDIVVVDQAHRGKGVGKLLMEQAEKRAYELGCESLELKVYQSNQKALEWYQKIGYQVLLSRLKKDVR